LEYLKGLNGPSLCNHPAHENSVKPSCFSRRPKANSQNSPTHVRLGAIQTDRSLHSLITASLLRPLMLTRRHPHVCTTQYFIAHPYLCRDQRWKPNTVSSSRSQCYAALLLDHRCSLLLASPCRFPNLPLTASLPEVASSSTPSRALTARSHWSHPSRRLPRAQSRCHLFGLLLSTSPMLATPRLGLAPSTPPQASSH
jgi:hypothetical protein